MRMCFSCFPLSFSVLFYSGLFLFLSLFSKEKMKEGMELDGWVCGEYLEINEVGKL